MEAQTGTALRGLKLFLRATQLTCAAIVLSIFSYLLAALSNHGLSTPEWVRAVEGISGIAILYTALCIVTLCWFPSAAAARPFTSLVSMVLDVSFSAAFIYVAAANKGGSGSCSGIVDTPFGRGDADTGKIETTQEGFTALPSLRQACQLETACLAVAVIALFFFLFSVLAELALIRHQRKERQLRPQPLNGFGEEHTAPTEQGQEQPPRAKGFWSSLFGRKKKAAAGTGAALGLVNPNALPEHATPDDYRSSYTTERTRVDTAHDGAGPKYGSLEYAGHDITDGHGGTGVGIENEARWDEVPLARYPPANYRYSDGVYDRV